MMTTDLARACGSCTACCKALEVVELIKPPGKWCPHCSIGKGCKIYADRPSSCREFRCEWLKGLGEEQDRPDRTKVILDYIKLPEGLPGGVFQMWELSESSLASAYVKRMTIGALKGEVWVSHIPLHGRKKIFVPKSQIVTEEIASALMRENITVADWP